MVIWRVPGSIREGRSAPDSHIVNGFEERRVFIQYTPGSPTYAVVTVCIHDVYINLITEAAIKDKPRSKHMVLVGHHG